MAISKSKRLELLKSKIEKEQTETVWCSFHLSDGNNAKAEFSRGSLLVALDLMINVEKELIKQGH